MSFSDDEDFDDIYGDSPNVEKKEISEPSLPEIKEPTPSNENSEKVPSIPAAEPVAVPDLVTDAVPSVSSHTNTSVKQVSAADQAVVAALSASLDNDSGSQPSISDQLPSMLPPISSESNTPAPTGSVKADLSAEITKMFVGGLNWDTSEDDLKAYFSKYGPVVSVQIRKDREGKSKGYGFVDFENASSITEVLATRHILDGKVIDPKRAIPKTEQDKIGKIFVGGLHPEIKPKAFEEFFAKYGNIIDAQLMINKNTGMCRGFGFITYDTPQAIEPLVAAKFIDFNGKKIEIKRAEQKASLATPARGRPTHFNEQGTPSQLAAMQNPMGMPMDPQQMQQYWAMMQENYRQMAEQQGVDVSQMMQQGQQQMYMMMNMMNNPNNGMGTPVQDQQNTQQQSFDSVPQGIPVIGDQKQDNYDSSYGFNENSRFNDGNRFNDEGRFNEGSRFNDEGRFNNGRGGFRGGRGSGFRGGRSGGRGGFRGGRSGFRGGRGGSRDYHPYRN